MRPPVKAHTVVARPGHFHVTSGRSGQVYIVTPTSGDRADCTCEFGRHAKADGPVCSHVKAVREFAARVTALPPVEPEADPFARIKAADGGPVTVTAHAGNDRGRGFAIPAPPSACVCGAEAAGRAHSIQPWCPALDEPAASRPRFCDGCPGEQPLDAAGLCVSCRVDHSGPRCVECGGFGYHSSTCQTLDAPATANDSVAGLVVGGSGEARS